nr:TetR family transcriptional regulator [Paenibacillus donghaensis]
MSTEGKRNSGLRERKKAKTMASVQMHALRLFREQGYSATTVEQIAEAAEISPSTFFRYFSTKEDVMINDNYDPLLIAAFEDQPAGLSPIQAVRAAINAGISEMSTDELDVMRQRDELIGRVPELRAANLKNMIQTIELMAGMLAKRTGRSSDDLEIRTLAGAIVGVNTSIMLYCAEHREFDFAERMDKALSFLEAGLPLQNIE